MSTVYTSFNATDPMATVVVDRGFAGHVTPADLNVIYAERYRDERFRTEIRLARVIDEREQGRHRGAHRRPRRLALWFRELRGLA